MITPELFAKIPKSQLYYMAGAPDEPSQESLMMAAQGIEPGVFGFLMYVYAGDQTARHDFFAELYMEVMQDAATQLWIQQRKQPAGCLQSQSR